MKITIPNNLTKEFIQLLELALNQTDRTKWTVKELKCCEFVQKIIDKETGK
jgi:hypothetical protein